MTSTRLVPIVLAIAGLALAACGGQPGAAAIVGPDRISEDQLATQVEEVYTAQGQSVDAVNPDVTTSVLTTMIQIALVDQVARELGVDVTQGALDRRITEYVEQSEGTEQFQQLMLQGGIAPSQIESVVRMSMQVESIGAKLIPDGPPDVQRGAATDAVVAWAAQSNIEVSARYGEWTATALQVGPLASDLSIPAGTSTSP